MSETKYTDDIMQRLLPSHIKRAEQAILSLRDGDFAAFIGLYAFLRDDPSAPLSSSDQLMPILINTFSQVNLQKFDLIRMSLLLQLIEELKDDPNLTSDLDATGQILDIHCRVFFLVQTAIQAYAIRSLNIDKLNHFAPTPIETPEQPPIPYSVNNQETLIMPYISKVPLYEPERLEYIRGLKENFHRYLKELLCDRLTDHPEERQALEQQIQKLSKPLPTFDYLQCLDEIIALSAKNTKDNMMYNAALDSYTYLTMKQTDLIQYSAELEIFKKLQTLKVLHMCYGYASSFFCNALFKTIPLNEHEHNYLFMNLTCEQILEIVNEVKYQCTRATYRDLHRGLAKYYKNNEETIKAKQFELYKVTDQASQHQVQTKLNKMIRIFQQNRIAKMTSFFTDHVTYTRPTNKTNQLR